MNTAHYWTTLKLMGEQRETTGFSDSQEPSTESLRTKAPDPMPPKNAVPATITSEANGSDTVRTDVLPAQLGERSTTAVASSSPPNAVAGAPSHISVEFSSSFGDSNPRNTERASDSAATQEGQSDAGDTQLSLRPHLQDGGGTLTDGQGSHTTLQSVVRPDLMTHGLSDPRRFISIERELSESSAAVKFLEKRLNRLEKDSRIALAVAAVALLLAVLALAL